MDTEKEVEKDQEPNTPRISPSDEKDLLAGITHEIDNKENNPHLTHLSEELEGIRRNQKTKKAWVRRIITNELEEEERKKELPDHIYDVQDNQIVIEFLLPSGDTFWERYTLPTNKLEEDSDLMQLLEHTGVPFNDLNRLLGSSVYVNEENGKWFVDISSEDPRISSRERTLQKAKEKIRKVSFLSVVSIMGLIITMGFIHSIIFSIPVLIYVVVLTMVPFITMVYSLDMTEKKIDEIQRKI